MKGGHVSRSSPTDLAFKLPAPVAAEQEATLDADESPMPDTIKTGTILIKEATLLPEALRVESEPCAPGWRFVKNLDGGGLDRKIHEAGWTFFSLAEEIKASVFGIDEQKAVRRAVERILANLKSEKFNSLEIARVASVASRRFLGVCYVTVSAHSRHVQESPLLFQATGSRLKQAKAAATL